MSIVEMLDYDRDLLWIEVFGEPYRDAEMLLWDGLFFNEVTRKIESLVEERN
jgi:hypothetical protein